MDKEDQNDIIKKVENSGKNDDNQQDTSNDNNAELNADNNQEQSSDNQEDNNEQPDLNEESNFILQNPKKSSIFAPKGSKEYNEMKNKLRETFNHHSMLGDMRFVDEDKLNSCPAGMKKFEYIDKNGEKKSSCLQTNFCTPPSIKESIKNRLRLLKEAYVDGDGNFQDKEMRDPNLLDFDIPEWALSSLINGDDSGLEDEDIQKINKFVDKVVAKYGNAHFMMDDIEGEDNLGFRHSNDIDNLGSNVYRLYLRPSKNVVDENNIQTQEPEVKPTETKPLVKPSKEPLRRNKPFLPRPSVQPDPKAGTKDTLIDENNSNSTNKYDSNFLLFRQPSNSPSPGHGYYIVANGNTIEEVFQKFLDKVKSFGNKDFEQWKTKQIEIFNQDKMNYFNQGASFHTLLNNKPKDLNDFYNSVKKALDILESGDDLIDILDTKKEFIKNNFERGFSVFHTASALRDAWYGV